MCLCIYHENMRLLENATEKLPSVTDLLKHAVCDVKSQKCMFQSCECCCKLLFLNQYCTNNFTDKELQREIRYCHWMNKNCSRHERSKLSGTVLDVINSIGERLEYYLFHVFIKRSQEASSVEKTGNLKIGQALFYFDFSGNYSLCLKMK